MTLGLKLLIGVWLLIVARFMGALLASRHCLRIRNATKVRATYETFTAFGVGMGIWGMADFFTVWNGLINLQVVNWSNNKAYLTAGILLELFKTMGVWLITMVLMNGGSPGFIRRTSFTLLERLRIMRPPN